jgi:hypothetical protein
MIAVRRFKNEISLMSFMFKNDARSLACRVSMWLSVKNVDMLVNGRPTLFGID